MTELLTRSVAVQEVDLEARTITGLAVPFGQVTSIGEYRESFDKGAIASYEGVKLFSEHRDVIGKVTKGEETPEGYVITARISETAKGDEIYTLLKDGVLDRFSVGFLPQEHRIDDEGVLVRTRVALKEVSVVAFPAYDGAGISEVRTSGTNNTKEVSNETMEKETYASVADVADLRDAVEEVERRVANYATTEVKEASAARSMGDFVKGIATGDEKVINEARAYTGAVVADGHTSNDWKADALKIVDRGRPLVNIFDKAPLGAHGLSVEFPKVSGITGDVALQAAEGDNLAYLEVGVTTGTAPVKTYGAYSELTRQAIERTDVSYLDAVLRAQLASYAKVTNAAVRAAIVAATPQTSGVASFALTAATPATFVSLVADAVQKIDTNGYYGQSADVVLVSWDVYQKMVTLTDSSGRPVFDINGDGSNTVGDAGLVRASASIAGMPVVVDPGLAVKTLYVANSHAVSVWENAGAPLRLQDETIINLAKQFAIYGYMAVGVKDANGLVKATIS